MGEEVALAGLIFGVPFEDVELRFPLVSIQKYDTSRTCTPMSSPYRSKRTRSRDGNDGGDVPLVPHPAAAAAAVIDVIEPGDVRCNLAPGPPDCECAIRYSLAVVPAAVAVVVLALLFVSALAHHLDCARRGWLGV